MNILPLILIILMVLSFSSGALFQKHVSSRKAQAAYISLRKAERNILRQSEYKGFKEAPGATVKPTQNKLAQSTPKEKKEVPIPRVNPSCSKLNLFPLIQDGKEAHLARYELAAKLLRLFYQNRFFLKQKRFEYYLLDQLLASAKPMLEGKDSLPLETIALLEPELQPLYYQLLKGTKHPDLFSSTGYPALIDFLKIEKDDTPICLFHAHPHMLAPFFGLKSTLPLYQKLHTEVKNGIELEALLLLANDPQVAFTDSATWKLLDLEHPKHKKLSQETLLAEDRESGILIRHHLRS